MAIPDAFSASLAAFFDRHPLVENAVLARSGDPHGQLIKVHFFDEASTPELLQIKYQTTVPTAQAKTEDIQNTKAGDTLTLREMEFSVVNVEWGATGVSTLVLSRDVQRS